MEFSFNFYSVFIIKLLSPLTVALTWLVFWYDLMVEEAGLEEVVFLLIKLCAGNHFIYFMNS
jgi:hypothetical protein